MIKTIDLFAGCGGLSCGFEKAGFYITDAVECDKDIAKSYEFNHKQTRVIADDIRNVSGGGVFAYGCADVIIGGPPCQGFSMAGARIRKNGVIEDSRNYLFKQYFNIVQSVRPKVFVIENVKGIQTLKRGAVFKEIIDIFSDAGNFDGKPYHLQYKVMKARECGIPQARERMFIIGCQNEFLFDTVLERAKANIIKQYPDFFAPVTVWQAISNLSAPTSDGVVDSLRPDNAYQQFLAGDGKTYNHIESHHSEKAVARMARVGIDENFTVLNENINSVHSGSYGRLNPDGVAPTVTTRFDTPSGGKFIHPYENRTVTPREAARLQSFPDSFMFVGSKTAICRQIGNAVPPKLAYVIANMVKELL